MVWKKRNQKKSLVGALELSGPQSRKDQALTSVVRAGGRAKCIKRQKREYGKMCRRRRCNRKTWLAGVGVNRTEDGGGTACNNPGVQQAEIVPGGIHGRSKFGYNRKQGGGTDNLHHSRGRRWQKHEKGLVCNTKGKK